MATLPHFFFNGKEVNNGDKLSPEDVTNLFTLRNVSLQVDKIYAISFTNDSYKPGYPFTHYLRANIGSDLSHNKVDSIILIDYRPPNPDKSYDYSISVFVQDGAFTGNKADFDNRSAFNKFSGMVKLTPISVTKFSIGPKTVVEQPTVTNPINKSGGDLYIKMGDTKLFDGGSYKLEQLTGPVSIPHFPWETNSRYMAAFYSYNGNERIMYKMWVDITTDDRNNIKAGSLLIDKPFQSGSVRVLMVKLNDKFELSDTDRKDLSDPLTAYDKLSKLLNDVKYDIKVVGTFNVEGKTLTQPVRVVEAKPGPVTTSTSSQPAKLDPSKSYFTFNGKAITEGSIFAPGETNNLIIMLPRLTNEGDYYYVTVEDEFDHAIRNTFTGANFQNFKTGSSINNADNRPPTRDYNISVYKNNESQESSESPTIFETRLANPNNLIYRVRFKIGKFVPFDSSKSYFKFGDISITENARFSNEDGQKPLTISDLPYTSGKYYTIVFQDDTDNQVKLLKANMGIDSSKAFDFVNRTKPDSKEMHNYSISIYQTDLLSKSEPVDNTNALERFTNKYPVDGLVYQVKFQIGGLTPVPMGSSSQNTSSEPVYITFGDMKVEAKPSGSIDTLPLEKLRQNLKVYNLQDTPGSFYILDWYDITESTNRLSYKLWMNLRADGSAKRLVDYLPIPGRVTNFQIIKVKGDPNGVLDNSTNQRTAHTEMNNYLNSIGGPSGGRYELAFLVRFKIGADIAPFKPARPTATAPPSKPFAAPTSGGYFKFGSGDNAIIKPGSIISYEDAQQPLHFHEGLPYEDGKYYIISLMASEPSVPDLKITHHLFMVDRGADDDLKFDYIERTPPQPKKPTKYTLSIWEQPHGPIPTAGPVPSEQADIFRLFPDISPNNVVYSAEFTVLGPSVSQPNTSSSTLPPCDCSLCKGRS